MNCNRKVLIIIFIFFSTFISSQEIQFYGNFNPGNLIIGVGENIQWAWLDNTELQIDSGKIFAFGFDAKETGNKILIVKHDDGRVLLKKIKLPKRKYRIQKINSKKSQFKPLPDSLKNRIIMERKIANTARKKIGEIKTALFKSGFIRPVKGGWLSSVFGSQRILNGVKKNMHNGIDIAVPRGTPVRAMADGVIVLTADNFYYSGNYVLIDHGLGVNSFYLHLSKILVTEGKLVKKGEIIGEVGTTGRSTGPHLHWGVQWFSKRVDPSKILKMNFVYNTKG